MVKEEEKISSGDSKRERNTFPSLFRFFRSSSVFSGLIQTCRLQLSLFFFFRIQGESEFPFPAIPGNTSLKFPSPSRWKIPFPFPSRNPGMQFLISRPVPGKRNLQPGIRTGNASILYNFAHFLSEIDPWYQ